MRDPKTEWKVYFTFVKYANSLKCTKNFNDSWNSIVLYMTKVSEGLLHTFHRHYKFTQSRSVRDFLQNRFTYFKLEILFTSPKTY